MRVAVPLTEKHGRPYIITVCKDGFVSVMERSDPKQRRLGAALPLMSVSEITDAMELVRRLCVYSRCHHGKKTGTLIEPRIIGWPRDGGSLTDLEKTSDLFMQEYRKLLDERTALVARATRRKK